MNKTDDKDRQSFESSGNKRHIFENIDDDSTFLPPALSSYGIALLNNKSSQKITGIYEIDFPDKRRTSNLKNKLSVHFKESSSGNLLSDSGNDGNILQHNTSNNSFHDSHGMSHSIQSSFNGSNNNNSTHTQATASEEDIIDAISPQNSKSPVSVSASVDNPIQSISSNNSRSSIHTLKRMRGSRRFGRMLGPPMRAPKVNEENAKSIGDISYEDSKTPPQKPVEISTSLKTPIRIHEVNNDFEGKSKFVKALENMRQDSPKIDLLSKERENELRKRIEEQKMLNELELEANRFSRKIEEEKRRSSSAGLNFSTSGQEEKESNGNNDIFSSVENIDSQFIRENSKQTIVGNDIQVDDKENFNGKEFNRPRGSSFSRRPLTQIPASSINVFNEQETFRKPKIPRVQQNIQPRLVSSEKNEHNDMNSTPKSEEKKKKLITINGNQYEKLELMGRGGSSKVYKAKTTSNNRLFAIKKVTFDQFDETCINGFKGEIDLLLKLKDEDRVVKLFDHAISDGSIYLVMECGDIDLAHVFQNKLNLKHPLDLDFVRFHSIEILKCVQAVHNAGIVHSDLKPANFLFVRGILKIIDFGIANAVPDHTANIYRESQIGTPNYMAPEALVEVNQGFPSISMTHLQQKNTWKVGKPSDIWSCGCIIYQMIYGKPPYGAYSGNQRIMAIMNPQVKIVYSNRGIGNIKVPQSAIELMQKCLARNPNDRWRVEECLNSDFLKPKVVSESFIRDLVHLAVNFGYNNRVNGSGLIASDVYDKLVDTVLKQIEDLNY